ncbi:hypothetical protein AVDCRST_MAG92-2367 [uncultured Coleofasciculus sp.]|uniref:Uncharacterized protein n=1 Tax=uncultured Coleofasciculus sp. TaxID=1267456 RepID=A0A6J4IQU4_9CYAN|nr:hypothetical protein AVDCRST_MAG92-2367 [uncultured Coleofasciculus sp.]
MLIVGSVEEDTVFNLINSLLNKKQLALIEGCSYCKAFD